eukprot:CAMPEP_0115551816 /NCGR_PEP_ID=MMETSP0271-20121206/95922_1 /TAXON_ID=71861 /ORGANISM="Scrippsiella trochoidea, Strain CCMP3099" /LENGTH=65 /DNA_ID=CAMNT_0002985421 /DNA_START=325 /DNA_END=522 /DNA_ORIENTATION=+
MNTSLLGGDTSFHTNDACNCVAWASAADFVGANWRVSDVIARTIGVKPAITANAISAAQRLERNR